MSAFCKETVDAVYHFTRNGIRTQYDFAGFACAAIDSIDLDCVGQRIDGLEQVIENVPWKSS